MYSLLKIVALFWQIFFPTLVFAGKMNVIYEWKYIDYVWNSTDARDYAIRTGNYDLKNPILIDVDRSAGALMNLLF